MMSIRKTQYAKTGAEFLTFEMLHHRQKKKRKPACFNKMRLRKL